MKLNKTKVFNEIIVTNSKSEIPSDLIAFNSFISKHFIEIHKC